MLPLLLLLLSIGGFKLGGFGSTCGIEKVDKLYKLTGGGASN
jgi:hypothetical protein